MQKQKRVPHTATAMTIHVLQSIFICHNLWLCNASKKGNDSDTTTECIVCQFLNSNAVRCSTFSVLGCIFMCHLIVMWIRLRLIISIPQKSLKYHFTNLKKQMVKTLRTTVPSASRPLHHDTAGEYTVTFTGQFDPLRWLKASVVALADCIDSNSSRAVWFSMHTIATDMPMRWA